MPRIVVHRASRPRRPDSKQTVSGKGGTVSQFLLDSALERAAEVTERATRITTSREAFKNMMTVLDQPSRPLPRLRKAAQRYKGTVDGSDQERTT
ncbi:DUF1778 domain-containing protein [Aquisalimonas lutea]|uniref:type II toxin-antitoxin system TacA family antitoxin n=1 Tax=Aquisalimonas lutea TaxID=1327750 RepID=UPI0025B58FB2|nr:DUF1778 domain-containing protein [Aquisalimonas lutea]MDN3516594.1 DUF1778 domain-containing protein [Aquisalimonas lutea]